MCDHLLIRKKAHPLLPFPLYMAAEFLLSHKSIHESFGELFWKIMDALKTLQSVSNLAKDHVRVLESQAVPAVLDQDDGTRETFRLSLNRVEAYRL